MTVEITGQTGDVCVGEKISLGIRYTVMWGVLKSIEWTIPGLIVKNYESDQNRAVVTNVKYIDKKKFTIAFYWVDGEDNRKVEAKCVFTSNGKDVNKTVSATFNVKKPTLDKFEATTDSVKLHPPDAPERIGFGVRGGAKGIKWDWKVTVPDIADGWIMDLQLMKVNNKAVTIGGVKQVRAFPGTKVAPPEYLLDTDHPYSLPDDYPPCPGFPHKVTAGDSFSDNSTFDTPSNPLPGFRYKTIDREFKYYILYKPDKPDSIYIPVAKAEWNCKGAARLNTRTGEWLLENPSGGVTSKGAVTTVFPEYTRCSRGISYENE